MNDGFYSNTVFHRVVKGFVVQGGGYAIGQTTLKSTNAPIILEKPSETGLTNIQGTISMARTTGLNSATSQFFFNTVDNTSLDTTSGGYAVFGSVVKGMDVVKAIEAVAVDGNSWPTTAVTVTSASQTTTGL
jgi:cyclophilin family peptidyl-prolyl cis-trans isomerase